MSYIHGNGAIERDINIYLREISSYTPANYNNFKDAYTNFHTISHNAFSKIAKKADINYIGLSYRFMEEYSAIQKVIEKEIYKVHDFDVYAFINTNIDHMVKTTRNMSRYNKLIKKIDKFEVDNMIGNYIENIVASNINETSPTHIENVVLNKLRPAIIDMAYAFNVEKRPSKWKTESKVVKLSIKMFNGHKVFEQGSPGFLGNQRYDVWIPSLKVAIEYNGKQHYEYVAFFHKGGKSDLINQKKRDIKKRKLSLENDIKLIEIPYTVKNIENFLTIEAARLNII